MNANDEPVIPVHTEPGETGIPPESSFPRPTLPLGTVYQTPSVADLDFDRHHYLFRHSCGDWGDFMEECDDHLNEAAVLLGAPVISRFEVSTGVRVCIITNGDRTLTRMVLAREL